jgi:hypothetical protein
VIALITFLAITATAMTIVALLYRSGWRKALSSADYRLEIIEHKKSIIDALGEERDRYREFIQSPEARTAELVHCVRSPQAREGLRLDDADGAAGVTGRGDFCQVFSGGAFYPFDPRPEEVRIEEIAHALALQCRFGGHCREFYSVAQHCVLASQIAAPEHAFAALMHDAAEAYISDLVRPIKRAPGFAMYAAIEASIINVIADRFGLVRNFDRHPEVKRVDDVMLATEKRDLLAPSSLQWAPLPPPHPTRITPWPWRDAEISFLARFGALR